VQQLHHKLAAVVQLLLEEQGAHKVALVLEMLGQAAQQQPALGRQELRWHHLLLGHALLLHQPRELPLEVQQLLVPAFLPLLEAVGAKVLVVAMALMGRGEEIKVATKVRGEKGLFQMVCE
jgi:hypothetical protein